MKAAGLERALEFGDLGDGLRPEPPAHIHSAGAEDGLGGQQVDQDPESTALQRS